MLFTKFGIVIESRERHSLNAASPMLFTEFGIVIEARE